jgi:hypothetical protein
MLNINPLYFIISFAVGILFVYIITPPPEIVLKFPSPYNAGNVTYKDKGETCYKYRADTVSCTKTDKKVLPQPILEDFKLKELFRQRNTSNLSQ